MDQELRATWGAEKWVIDRLVEAVEAGDADEKLKLAKHLLDGYKRHDWRRRRIVDAGIILLTSELDPGRADPQEVSEALEQAEVPESRLKQVSEGATLTDSELAVWREFVVEAAFDQERVSMRLGNVCLVIEVKHSDTRRAYLAVQKWNGRSGVLVASYQTSTEAKNALASIGIFRMDSGLTWEEESKSDSRHR
jgi:hypothetical protein